MQTVLMEHSQTRDIITQAQHKSYTKSYTIIPYRYLTHSYKILITIINCSVCSLLCLARRRRKINTLVFKNVFSLRKQCFKMIFSKGNPLKMYFKKPKISKKSAFGRFNKNTPPPCYRSGTNKGGILIKGGILNNNTIDVWLKKNSKI